MSAEGISRAAFLQSLGAAGAGIWLAGCSRRSELDLLRCTVEELQAAIAIGRHTALEIAKAHLERIKILDRAGPMVKSILALNPDAEAIAEALDEERKAGKLRSPLHGIPIVVKDNLNTHDRMSTTAGSLALAGSIAPRDADIVVRLREAGCVILGKTNLSEWANFRGRHSTSGWSAMGGQTRNPHRLSHGPSGSSSGSAAAVAAGFSPLSIGTETNGSIVSPASQCGIVGLKPTVGLLSGRGIIPISSSQDTAGPMARTVTDVAALLAILIDPAGSNEAKETHHGLLTLKPKPKARLGVLQSAFKLHPLVDPLFEKAMAALKASGATLVDDIKLPAIAELEHADLTVMLYEFKAGLNAYFASLGPTAPIKNIEGLFQFNEEHAAQELGLFGQEYLLLAASRGDLTSAEYLEAKQKCVAWSAALESRIGEQGLDAVIAPTTGPASAIDYVHGEQYLGGCSTYAAVAGLPHVTVPCGGIEGLPVGLSFFGRRWSDARLLEVALAFEDATRARLVPAFVTHQ